MDIVLWIVQGLLAVAFVGAGAMKLFTPYDKFKVSGASMGNWTQVYQPWWIKTIGALEVAGGIGMVAPMLTNILPFLTPLAGIGLGMTMIGAMITHLRHGENSKIIPNIVLLVLALVVVIGRLPLLTGA